jgi:transcriptional regulator with XRE-family HTH domain
MLGEQIKTLRLAHKMSQVELAEKLNVSKQAVSNWENNNIQPSVDLLKRIAQYFKCSTDYLLEMEPYQSSLHTTCLTMEQTIHIQQLIQDFETLNKQTNAAKAD